MPTVPEPVRSAPEFTLANNEWHISIVDQVPIALKAVASSQCVGLLCKVRLFDVADEEVAARQIIRELPPNIQEQINARAAECSVEDGYLWLNLFSAEELFSNPEKVSALTQLLAAIPKKLNLKTAAAKCDACGISSPTEAAFHQSKFWFICPECKRADEEAFVRQAKLDPKNLPLLIGAALTLAIPCAVLWAGSWFIYDSVMDLFKVDKLPVLLLSLVYGCVGLVVGLPISFLFKKLPGRGMLTSVFIVASFTAFGIVAGEFVYSTYLFYKVLGTFPYPTRIPYAWWLVMREAGMFYMFGKFVAAVIACSLAANRSLPRRHGFRRQTPPS